MNTLRHFRDLSWFLSRSASLGALHVLALAVAPGLTLAAVAPASGQASAGELCDEPEFESAEIYVIFNSTDNDAQLIIAGSGETAGGITALSVDGPFGAVTFDAVFVDGRKVGQADFQFDTMEPSLAKLKGAYPAGRYRFSATTTSNCTLRSVIRLSYRLPPAPVIVFPMEGDTGVPSNGFTAMWEEIADVETVRFAIEDEDGELKVDLPGDATSFNVPGEFLKPGVLYTMDVIAVSEAGNRTATDVQFTTEL